MRVTRRARYHAWHTVYNNISCVRRGHCHSLLSLQRNRTITPINFMNGPLARQSLTPLVCALSVRGERSERRKEKKMKEKDEREVYRTRCHPSFCAVVVHGSARSLQPSPRHNALSSSTRTVSRYAIVESPCPPPPPPPPYGTLLIVAKKVSSAKCAAQPARVAHGRHTCVRTNVPPALLDRRSFHEISFALSHVACDVK